MLQKRFPQARGVSEPFPIPAPLLGLNVRENYTQLQATEARVLENWLPDEGSCRVRPGRTPHQEVTGVSSVETMMSWFGATGQKLVAAADGEIYDVSGTPSALTSSAGYSDDQWSYANYNAYLFAVNGTDTPWRYDGGSAVAATGFTGPTLTELQTVTQVRNRLWFSLTDNADVVYGGIGSVTGALTTFQLSQIAAGGKCMDVGSWSRDAGDGADDFTFFVMDTGEVIVYQGDPATSFALVGKYASPAPISKDCVVKIGGEALISTVSGPIPVSGIIAGNAFRPEVLNPWGKIAPLWAADYKLYGSNSGWNAYFHGGLVYFVVRTGLMNSRIFVFNTRNQAPTLYTNIPATSFSALNGELYFGGTNDAYVYRHATGSDDGEAIVALARQGWSYPLSGRRDALFTIIRPNISASSTLQAQFQVDVDFSTAEIDAPIVTLTSETEGAEWDVSDWDADDWASDPVTHRLWYGARGKGRAVAPVVRTYSQADLVEWAATDIMAKPAGRL